MAPRVWQTGKSIEQGAQRGGKKDYRLTFLKEKILNYPRSSDREKINYAFLISR